MDAVRCAGCDQRDAELARLRQQLVEQAAELAALQQRLDDVTKRLPKRPAESPAKPKPAEASHETATPKRKPGGQPGHPAHLKRWLPPEQVQHFVPLAPTTCRCCHKPLPRESQTDDPEPRRHQVADLPRQLVEVTEYRLEARTCQHCGKVTRAALPAEVGRVTIGTRLAALFAYLVGRQHVSKRGVEEIGRAHV